MSEIYVERRVQAESRQSGGGPTRSLKCSKIRISCGEPTRNLDLKSRSELKNREASGSGEQRRECHLSSIDECELYTLGVGAYRRVLGVGDKVNFTRDLYTAASRRVRRVALTTKEPRGLAEASARWRGGEKWRLPAGPVRVRVQLPPGPTTAGNQQPGPKEGKEARPVRPAPWRLVAPVERSSARGGRGDSEGLDPRSAQAWGRPARGWPHTQTSFIESSQ